MKILISMRPKYHLLLELATVETLIVLARAHYDGDCKAAGFDRGAARPITVRGRFEPTPVSGFLIGWRNVCRNNGQVWDEKDEPSPPLACGADSDQLQLVLKICEPLHSAVSFKQVTPAQGQMLNDLCALILTAVRSVPAVSVVEVTTPTPQGHTEWATSPGRY